MAVNGWKLLEMAGISGWDDNDDGYELIMMKTMNQMGWPYYRFYCHFV